ncbi:YIP1 family protein [Flavobacterium psychrophilum]|nr:YIP1 family protein [Flavobacterium psychrophilum]
MKILFLNPFKKYSDTILLLFGITFTVLGSLLAYNFNAKFDGLIDLHFDSQVNFFESATYQFLAILILTASLYWVGKYINKKTRLVDVLITVLISRIPLYFCTLFNINNKSYSIGNKILELAVSKKINTLNTNDIGFILFQSIILIIALIWFISLLYNGFKIATNSKETKHTLLFILAIIIAEITSKIIIYKLL